MWKILKETKAPQSKCFFFLFNGKAPRNITIRVAFPANKLFFAAYIYYVFNTCHRPPAVQWEINLGLSFVNKYHFIFFTRCDYKLNQENPTT